MSFFLLGKGSEGGLRLLSAKLAASRKDALAELSRITADPEFSDWDDEVYVVDLEQATPVLLVRPTTPSEEPLASAPETDGTEGGEAEIDALEELFIQAAVTEDAVEDTADEAIAQPDTPVESAWAEVVVETAFEQGVAVTEALVAEAARLEAERASQEPATSDEKPSSKTDPADEPEQEGSDDGENAELHAAVDPVLAYEPEESGPTPEEREEPLVIEVPSVADTADPMTAEESRSDADESEVDHTAPETEEQTADVVPLPVPVAVEPAWPWASLGEPEDGLHELEEPGSDEGSLIKLPVEHDVVEMPRAVILGDYEGLDEAEAPTPALGKIDDVAHADDLIAPAETAAEPEEPQSPPLSDFILDLEEIDEAAVSSEAAAETLEPEPESLEAEIADHEENEPADGDTEVETAESDVPLAAEAEPVEPPPGYMPSGDATEDMTCEDCVYFDSCPNKDQREPSSCGSFMWK